MMSYYPTVPRSSRKIQVKLEMGKYAKKSDIFAAAGILGPCVSLYPAPDMRSLDFLPFYIYYAMLKDDEL